MQKKSTDFFDDVKKALKSAGKYNRSLDLQILSLAGSLRALWLAIQEIDAIEVCDMTTVNRYGKESQVAHPAFKVLKDSQDAVTRQMKALGLTAAELMGSDDNDPLVDLTKSVRNAKRKKVVIKPES